MNPYGNPSALVDKRLGNSYAIVKAVFEKLEEIVFVANNLQNLTPKDVELQESDDRSFIQWRYVGSADWTNLVPLSDFPQAEFQVLAVDASLWLQWRYRGEAMWNNLYDLTAFFSQVVAVPTAGKIPRAGDDGKLDTGWLNLDEVNQAPSDAAAKANAAIAVINQTLTDMQGKIDDLQSGLTEAQSTIADHETRITTLEAQLADGSGGGTTGGTNQ